MQGFGIATLLPRHEDLLQVRWKILSKFNMQYTKPMDSLVCSSGKPSKLDGTSLIDQTTFRSIVDSLKYLTITKPDLTYAIGQVARFLSNLTDTHLIATKRILHISKGLIIWDYFFHINQTLNFDYSQMWKLVSMEIILMPLVMWIGQAIQNDWRSLTDACLYLGQDLISWHSKSQSSVTCSNNEAEYRGLANATTEV